MSSQCPFCHGDIQADFGLVTCPGCGKVLSVQMDGSVEGSSEKSDISENSDLNSEEGFGAEKDFFQPEQQLEKDSQHQASSLGEAEQTPDQEGLDAEVVQSSQDEQNPESQRQIQIEIQELIDVDMPSGSKPEFEVLMGESSLESSSAAGHEQVSSTVNSPPANDPTEPNPPGQTLDGNVSNTAESESLHLDTLQLPESGLPSLPAEKEIEQNSPMDSAPLLATDLAPLPLETALSDIVEFAESSNQPLISYQLVIEGVDLKVHSEKLKEVLKEKNLGLDFQQILDSIEKGRIELRGLNPAQAAVLRQRLIGSNFKMTWIQT